MSVDNWDAQCRTFRWNFTQDRLEKNETNKEKQNYEHIHVSRDSFSFQGSFFLEHHQKPWGNGDRFLKGTMAEKNGESTPRIVLAHLDAFAIRVLALARFL